MKNYFLISILILFSSFTGLAERQDVVDDGFTWFEAFSTSELTGVNNAPVSTGWALKSWVRVIGNYPNGSALKLVVSKAGQTVATTRCETYIYRKTGNELDESFMRTAECWQGKSATKETGNFDVRIFAINSETSQEKLVRQYKIEVRAISRVPSGQQPGSEPPRYLISRHAESPVAFLFIRPRGYIPYFDVADRPDRSGANLVELHLSLSPSETGRNLPHSVANCSVDGQRLSMPGPMPYATQVISRDVRWYQEIYQDRMAPKYKAGMPYQEEIRFQMVRVNLPLTWGSERDTNRLALEDYKGNWECTISNNGETWRMLRWKIGADGMPETHPEQRGNVNLGYNTFLIDMEIPAGGSPWDGRLTGASPSFFYGQPWSSPEGRTMAGRVPKKGNPFPVASNSSNAAKP